MLKITRKQWNVIEKQLKEEYKYQPSVFLIRSTMRRVLGFTTRQSSVWDEEHGKFIYLDFFDESKKSYFILKYL